MSSTNGANIRRDFRVSDCYVWTEIYYLDSATDYREYLTHGRTDALHTSMLPGDLTLLDPSTTSYRLHSYLCLAALFMFLVISCAFLYELLC
jgi:hypothetical protein